MKLALPHVVDDVPPSRAHPPSPTPEQLANHEVLGRGRDGSALDAALPRLSPLLHGSRTGAGAPLEEKVADVDVEGRRERVDGLEPRVDRLAALDRAVGPHGQPRRVSHVLLRSCRVVAVVAQIVGQALEELVVSHPPTVTVGGSPNQAVNFPNSLARVALREFDLGTMLRPRALLLVVAISSVVVAGCDKKPDPPAPQQNVAAAKPKPTPSSASSAAPSSTTPPVDPAAVERTAKSLLDHPPVSVPYAWERRILAHLRGETGGDACPTPPKKPANEFEKAGESPCKSDNDKAAGFLAACPTTVNLVVTLSKFDFTKKRFTLADAASDPALVTKSGRAWFTSGFQLDFPSALPAFKIDGTPTSMCGAGGTADAERSLSRLMLELPLEEAKAKGLREKLDATLKANSGMDTRIQVAFVLEGKTAADAGVCGLKPAKPVPTGKVVAWRLLVPTTPTITTLTDWLVVSPWEWSTTCDEAQSFFGGGKATPIASASGSAGPKAPGGKKTCEERCGDECMKEAPSMFMQCHGQCTMAKCSK